MIFQTEEMVQWQKYRGALLPLSAPHLNIKFNRWPMFLLVLKRSALFVRWTSDWDMSEVTEFWYVIKDSFTPLEKLTSKNRSEINRGLTNCEVKRVDARCMTEQMYLVYKKAFDRYNSHLAPLTWSFFERSIANASLDKKVEFWGVFDRSSGKLIGYSSTVINGDMVDYSTAKFDPDFLGNYPSYALFYTMNKVYLVEMGCRYVSDGARNIAHDTNIHEHLIRKHGFRKAYCRLNVVYHPVIWIAVNFLFFFRKNFKNSHLPVLAKMASVLQQEEIRRSITKK
jgi:hypothetical protein